MNQTLPSGPAAIQPEPPSGFGSRNSVITPAVVIRTMVLLNHYPESIQRLGRDARPISHSSP